jgi:hypothetical protein
MSCRSQVISMTLTTAEVPETAQLGPEPAPAPVPSAELAKIKYGVWLSGAAFLLLGVVCSLSVIKMTVGSDMVAAVGSVSTVVGTIIGAFFGAQIGSHGKEAAEADRADAEQAVRLALGKLDPESADHLNLLLSEARARSPRRPGRR